MNEIHGRRGTDGRRRDPAVVILCLMLFLILGASDARAARIKDLADIQGVRQNQLVGYGLIVGLEGTGDGKKSVFTNRAVSSMLEKMGIPVSPEEIKTKNIASVMVTAVLPPFARAGSRIDVVVSSIGDAGNLQGGTLVLTPLKGVDGKVYAVAQGSISTGGFAVEGNASTVQKNFLTVGRVPAGAVIEREVPFDFSGKDGLTLMLRQPDFTTCSRVADAINHRFPGAAAHAADPGTVQVKVAGEYSGDIVRFATLIEGLEVNPDVAARVIINERTGTVVMGQDVRISAVAVAHGNLSVQITEGAAVSQPREFSRRGETVVVPETDIAVEEGSNNLMLMDAGATIGGVVRALNALGVTPRDLIAILQAIKAAGALQAQLEII
ncbi:flagellar basal body P-ring protein FlgI [Desulfococcus sp.]|uniref:flagellar basal body P-ring protein FlgI n=1 Tax=Desulfococcus sp. TaxID=2025834 RepID=UPI00359336B6